MNPLTIITALLPALQVAGPILMQLFPAAQQALGALGNVNPAQHASIVTLMQEALNELGAVGVIALPKPLIVDGIFGGATFGAIKLVLTKAGFGSLAAEPLASIEYNFLKGWLAGK